MSKATGPSTSYRSPRRETGWLQETAFSRSYPPIDESLSYQSAYEAAKAGRPVLAESAKETARILIFPGINHDKHGLGKHTGYLTENIKALSEQGYRVSIVPVSPRGSLERDEPAMARAFDEAISAGQRVIAYAHSLGGVRIAQFLQKNPQYKPHVEFVVYDKSPIAGSDIAQAVQNNPAWREYYERLFESAGGDGELIEQLSYGGRRRSIQAYGLPTDVPSVAVIGVPRSDHDYLLHGGNPHAWSSFLGFGAYSVVAGLAWQQVVERLQGDGRLLKDDGLMPGGWYVKAPFMIHLSGNVGSRVTEPYNPRSHALAMLQLGYLRKRVNDAASPSQKVPAMRGEYS